jgi:mono/diheme cytochrome c family protein
MTVPGGCRASNDRSNEMKQRGMTEGRGGARRVAVAVLGVALAWPVAASAATDPDPGAVTFARDVAPILQQNCQVCHQPGAIGPMSLMTYDEVRPWARVIQIQVESRNMPPYHYDTHVGIQELKHDSRLSEEEIRTISRWVEAGAPLGDLADMPGPMTWPDPGAFQLARTLGEPDLVIRSDPFTVPASGQDMWWQPVVDTGLASDRCIMAIETKPSVAGRAVTHHANSTFRVRGDDNMVGSGGRLSEYALGKLGEIVPGDACRVAPANSQVAWDIHYYPSGDEVVDDMVEIGLWLYPEGFDGSSLYSQTLSSYRLSGGDYDIPPHGTLITQGFHSFDTPVRIDSFQPHGHLRLKAKSLEIFYPETGQREMVSQISNWNPGWHLSHMYEDHVAPLVPAGAILVITAWYDNTADNPWNPDPDQWVGIGNRTTDEMSHAWIAVTHLDEEGYRKLLAERQQPDAGEGSSAGN